MFEDSIYLRPFGLTEGERKNGRGYPRSQAFSSGGLVSASQGVYVEVGFSYLGLICQE
jgi:hypothetical protein